MSKIKESKEVTEVAFPDSVKGQIAAINTQMTSLQGQAVGIINGALAALGVDANANNVSINTVKMTYTVTPKDELKDVPVSS